MSRGLKSFKGNEENKIIVYLFIYHIFFQGSYRGL